MKRCVVTTLFCMGIMTFSAALALEKPYIEVNASDGYTVQMGVADNGRWLEADVLVVPESAMGSIVWQGGGEDANGYLVSMRDVSTDQQVGEARRPYELWNTEIDPFDFGIALDVPYKIGVAACNESGEEQWRTMYFMVASEVEEDSEDDQEYNEWPEEPTEEAYNEPAHSEWAEEPADEDDDEPESDDWQEEYVEQMPEAVEFYEPAESEKTGTDVAFSWSWPDHAVKFKFGLRDLDTTEKIVDDVYLNEAYYVYTGLTPGHQYRAAVASVSESGVDASWREVKFSVMEEQNEEFPNQPEQEPEQPEEEPELPEITPEQPDEEPEQPNEEPEPSEEIPEPSVEVPEQPEEQPNQPEQEPEQPAEIPIQPTEVPIQPEQTPEPIEEKEMEIADPVQIEGLTEDSLVGTNLTVSWNWPGNAAYFRFAMKDMTANEKIVPDQDVYESFFQCPALTPGHSYQIAVASIPYGWDGQAQTASWRVLKVRVEDDYAAQEDVGTPSVEVTAERNRIYEGSDRAFTLQVHCRNTRTITVEVDGSRILEGWAKGQNETYQKTWMFTEDDFNDYNYSEMKRTMEFYPETNTSVGKHTVTVTVQNGNGIAQATTEIEIMSREETLAMDIECPNIEFRSDEVKRGSIRFVTQVKKYTGLNSNAVFKEEQWKYGSDAVYDKSEYAYNKCSYATLSMALSYLGVDCLPGKMFYILKNKDFNQNTIVSELSKQNETLKLEICGEAGISDKSLSMEKLNRLIQNYEADTNYSPVIVWIQYTKNSGEKGHHMIALVGKQGDTYYFADPASGKGLNSFQINLVSTETNNEELRIQNSSWKEYENDGYISRIYQIKRD